MGDAVLSPEVQAELDAADDMDVMVGVLCKNVGSTVLHVLNMVNEGLHKHFSDYRKMIVVSDGYSSDRTVELATLFQPYNGIRKVVTEDMVRGGKGAGVKTIFEIAHVVKAKAVVLVDGDLLSIRPEWIYEFASPILYGRADLVVPYYVRDKYDGVITNNLIYPFTRALYGLDIRQPIAGEYGLSRELYEKLRGHPLFPLDFGIDIFIVTAAAAHEMEIREGLFYMKLHESTTRYLEPDELLIPMFRQVTGSMFELARHYEHVWRGRRNGRATASRACFCREPAPVGVALDEITARFREGYRTSERIIRNIVSDDSAEKLAQVAADGCEFDSELWAKTVYEFAAHYKRVSAPQEKHAVLDALKTLWLGRFRSYVLETADMNINDAERVIQEQAKVFEKQREYLLSIY